jgi:hypothetical protein
MGKPKRVYPEFQEAQILWECDFPSKPELLELLLKERISNKEEQGRLKEREKEINNSLLSFFTNNRIPGVVYERYTLSKKSGVSSTINRGSHTGRSYGGSHRPVYCPYPLGNRRMPGKQGKRGRLLTIFHRVKDFSCNPNPHMLQRRPYGKQQR